MIDFQGAKVIEIDWLQLFKLRPSYPEAGKSPIFIHEPTAIESDADLSCYLRSTFYESGILDIEINYHSTQKIYGAFESIIDMLGRQPIRDASRRESVLEGIKDSLSSVDMKYPHVDPHSETSFSPTKPAIIGFVCLDIEERAISSGKTIITDGFKAWSLLSLDLKKKLQAAYIDYSLCISLNAPKRIKGKGVREWYLDYQGVSNVYLNHDKQTLDLEYRTSFISSHPIDRTLSLANHFFVDLSSEEQIKSRTLVDGAGQPIILSDKDHDELSEAIHLSTQQLTWKKGKMLILDNFKYMHGRLPYDMTLNRKLFIRQLMRFSS